MYSSRDRYVLAVDDDPAYLSVLKLCMRTCGFNKVYMATDGASALERLECMRFDLIISDWNMQPMDGLELLKVVKSTPKLSGIPFILMSGNMNEAVWRQAVGLGAAECLAKPFSLTDLRYACFSAIGVAEYNFAVNTR